MFADRVRFRCRYPRDRHPSGVMRRSWGRHEDDDRMDPITYLITAIL